MKSEVRDEGGHTMPLPPMPLYCLLVLLLIPQHYWQGVAHSPPTPTVTSVHCRGCPYFISTPTNVTTTVGVATNLTCGVRLLGGRQVSWIRRRDLHVLTTDSFTYTTDFRFRAVHDRSSPYWVLSVANPAVSDSGVYECQVSTQPKIFRRFSLQVVEPRAKIVGGTAVYMRAGSDLNISCVVTLTASQAAPVTWYRAHPAQGGGGREGVEEVNSGGRGGVQLVTDRRAGTSWLLVTRATWRDAGTYTCAPARARPASVIVHVLDEESPAAMQPHLQHTNRAGQPVAAASPSSDGGCLATHHLTLSTLVTLLASAGWWPPLTLLP